MLSRAKFAAMKDASLPTMLSPAGIRFLLFLTLLGVSVSTAAQSPSLVAAGGSIQKRIASSGADVGVYFKTLDGQAEWSFHAEDVFHAASTMKVPVMVELFQQVNAGKLKLSDAIVIRNEFHSIVD